MVKLSLFGLFGLVTAAVADRVVYRWTATWVQASPDGFSRPVIGINGVWPCPEIRARVGDTIVIHLTNDLGNQTTGLHFHGINQVSTIWMDGPSMVTQCPLPPGMTMTYRFKADAPGTYWWHSHDMGQYPDGLRGPLIIEDPEDPYQGHFDEEYTLEISDWYHNDSITIMKAFLNPNNTRGIPPLPNSIILNEGTYTDYEFETGKRYRFRIISYACFASAMFRFGSHNMNVIMADGAYVEKQAVDTLRITPAQRYDIIVEASELDSGNFPIFVSLDQNRDWTNNTSVPPISWPLNATAYLLADEEGDRPEMSVDAWEPFDDAVLKPLVLEVLPTANKTLEFNWETCVDSYGIHRACVNGSPYVYPKVPTLYTAATMGQYNTDPIVYGNIHPFIVDEDDIVDIIVNNRDPAVHPFHLHGHHFQVLVRGPSGAGDWPGDSFNSSQELPVLNPNPPERDTVSVMAHSFAVLRFRANNPGVYLFHCHIEWHVEMGLSATIIEAPERLRRIPIPLDHRRICEVAGIPTAGNAGGSMDPTDTSNYRTEPEEEYKGAEWVPPPAKRLRPRISRP